MAALCCHLLSSALEGCQSRQQDRAVPRDPAHWPTGRPPPPNIWGIHPSHFLFSCLLIVCVLKYCWRSKSRTRSSSYPHWVILIKQFHSVWVLRPVHCLWLNPSLTSKWEDHSGALLCQNRTKSHLCVASAMLTGFFKQPKNGLWTGSRQRRLGSLPQTYC